MEIVGDGVIDDGAALVPVAAPVGESVVFVVAPADVVLEGAPADEGAVLVVLRVGDGVVPVAVAFGDGVVLVAVPVTTAVLLVPWTTGVLVALLGGGLVAAPVDRVLVAVASGAAAPIVAVALACVSRPTSSSPAASSSPGENLGPLPRPRSLASHIVGDATRSRAEIVAAVGAITRVAAPDIVSLAASVLAPVDATLVATVTVAAPGARRSG